ncbi:lipid droplet-associated protein [Gordonia sp. PS3]|uniref:lipid droplet-associated protein n=1 Tax=Gordonia TaxID=2053 RepID=UPI002415B228|nr:lipid droplet-associated protein [Gordonia sihwensis]WFN93790.1 lipid droplet-associated protein [Gordonia sihwensis]
MSRPPYAARVVAGLVATTIEETRKLPTRVITLPMGAVSRSLQAGMRLQQNIAELAIKGDELLAPLCDKSQEQPEWARFDEDDDAEAASRPLRADAPATVPQAPARAPEMNSATNHAETSAAEAPAASPDESAADSAAPPANAGRFALYSSAPADVAAGPTSTTPDAAASPEHLPAAVAALDYPTLTLAQLRAKVRGLGTEELTEILEFEKANRNRTPFVTMLDNRIVSQQKKAESAQ